MLNQYRVTTINVRRIWIELAEWAALRYTANSPFPGHVYCRHPVHVTALLQASPPAKSPRGRPPAKNGKADDDDDEEDEEEDGDDDDGSDFDPGSEEDNKKKRVSVPMLYLGRLTRSHEVYH